MQCGTPRPLTQAGFGCFFFNTERVSKGENLLLQVWPQFCVVYCSRGGWGTAAWGVAVPVCTHHHWAGEVLGLGVDYDPKTLRCMVISSLSVFLCKYVILCVFLRVFNMYYVHTHMCVQTTRAYFDVGICNLCLKAKTRKCAVQATTCHTLNVGLRRTGRGSSCCGWAAVAGTSFSRPGLEVGSHLTGHRGGGKTGITCPV